MTYRLFGRPYSGSLAVEWLLEELRLPYSRVLVTGYRDQIEPAWYAKLNPMCQVPALELDDSTLLTESGAIMLYLADRHALGGLRRPPTTRPARTLSALDDVSSRDGLSDHDAFLPPGKLHW